MMNSCYGTRSNSAINREQFLRLLEQRLEVEPNTLSGGDLLASISAWDSLAVLEYLALVDEHFGVTLEYERIAACSTVEELLALAAA